MKTRGANRAEAGYNLVILMVAITVMSILVAASLPLWSRIIQHDKEEELIFRGLQYAEAIRVFRIRFQRAPVRIEELLEAKPRCIRQLWKDPMTEDGKWKILYEGVQQVPGSLTPKGQEGQGDENAEAGDPKDPGSEKGSGSNSDPSGNVDAETAEGGSGFLTTEQKEKLTIGPIEGVTSKSHKHSAMVWFQQERYDQWQFRWQLVAQQKSFGVPPGVDGVQAAAPQGESTRWLGRPWPKWLGIQSAPPIPQPGGAGNQPGLPGPGDLQTPNPPNGGGAEGGAGGGAFGVPRGLPPDPNEPPPS
ncbi:MAG TPA: type II secretion system protein [Thermoanaerobaculia bacterium]|nr:type II secretion system protein [Thermoanaerobaculia bacterium]